MAQSNRLDGAGQDAVMHGRAQPFVSELAGDLFVAESGVKESENALSQRVRLRVLGQRTNCDRHVKCAYQLALPDDVRW